MASGLLLTALMVLAESCWLFPALGVLGVATAQDGSTIPWPGVLAMLAAGVTLTRGLVARQGSTPGTYMALTAAGLLAIYLAVASALAAGDLAWLPDMMARRYSGPEVVQIAATVLAGAITWRRAIRLGDEPHPDIRLLQTFRTGTLVLAVVLLVEMVMKRDLGAAGMILPFIAVTLSGLALAHRPLHAGLARNWAKVAAATVGTVLAAAGGAALLGGHFGGPILAGLASVWNLTISVVGSVLHFLLAPALKLYFRLIEYLRTLIEPGPRREITRPEVDWEKLDAASRSPFVEIVVDFVKFPLAALILFLLIRFLVKAHRSFRLHETVSPVSIAHETLARDGDALSDLAHILENLLPAWARGRKPKPGWRYPHGVAGVSEVFRLYFRMLDAGMARGHPPDPGATPRERAAELATLLPGVPVGDLTERFNAACYAGRPTDLATLESFHAALDAAEAEKEKA